MKHREAVMEAVSKLGDRLLARIICGYYGVCEETFLTVYGTECPLIRCGDCDSCPLHRGASVLEWLREDDDE